MTTSSIATVKLCLLCGDRISVVSHDRRVGLIFMGHGLALDSENMRPLAHIQRRVSAAICSSMTKERLKCRASLNEFDMYHVSS